MLLSDGPVDGEIARAGVLVLHRREENVRKNVVDFHGKRGEEGSAGGPEGMAGNLNTLARTKLADSFEFASLIKCEHEMEGFAGLHEVVAVAGRTGLGFIEGQALISMQQEGLDVSGRLHLKFGGAGCEDDRAAGFDFYLDGGRLERGSFWLGLLACAGDGKADTEQKQYDARVRFHRIELYFSARQAGKS